MSGFNTERVGQANCLFCKRCYLDKGGIEMNQNKENRLNDKNKKLASELPTKGKVAFDAEARRVGTVCAS